MSNLFSEYIDKTKIKHITFVVELKNVYLLILNINVFWKSPVVFEQNCLA